MCSFSTYHPHLFCPRSKSYLYHLLQNDQTWPRSAETTPIPGSGMFPCTSGSVSLTFLLFFFFRYSSCFCSAPIQHVGCTRCCASPRSFYGFLVLPCEGRVFLTWKTGNGNMERRGSFVAVQCLKRGLCPAPGAKLALPFSSWHRWLSGPM